MMDTQCSLCTKCTPEEDVLYFGEWMTKNDIKVHYYCLLLSTHLPQNGSDSAGILGFLLSDIRKEIEKAKQRNCMYCNENGASIMCVKCQKYLHLTCGHTNKCLFQFINEFHTYCNQCKPDDDPESIIVTKSNQIGSSSCFICHQQLHRSRVVYAKCCNNGFVHLKCMKSYALTAGYYLRCIWCKDTKFREDIKYQGVFVPDRDANWEREKGAYRDLYQRNCRCDIEECKCPKGRDYTSSKWQIIICKYCGASGAHNPQCISPESKKSTTLKEFICETCSQIEKTICHKTPLVPSGNDDTSDLIDSSLYIHKEETNLPQNISKFTNASDDSLSSVETIINANRSAIVKNLSDTTYTNIIPTLTQSSNGGNSLQSDHIIASSVYDFTEIPREAMEIGEINNADDTAAVAEIQIHNPIVIDDDSENALSKEIDKDEVLAGMNSLIAEFKENGLQKICPYGLAVVKQNYETIEKIKKSDPTAAAEIEAKYREAAKIQLWNPLGAKEVASSDSEDYSDEDQEETSKIKNILKKEEREFVDSEEEDRHIDSLFDKVFS